MKISLSNLEARRISIRAQCLDGPRLSSPISVQRIEQSIRTMGLIQIDSVNVCVRSHYMPLFSRLGIYDQILLDQIAYNKKTIFETWAHAACFIPSEDHHLFRPRMGRKDKKERLEQLISEKPNDRVSHLMALRPSYLDDVFAQVRKNGPMTASDLKGAGDRTGAWWGYSDGKIAMEWYFAIGVFSVAKRHNFARYYDLTEKVIPSNYLNTPTPSLEEAYREMVRLAIRAQGVGTIADIADYYHLKTDHVKTGVAELLECDLVQEVEVEGWGQIAYAPLKIALAEPTEACALLTPFDPLVWTRKRVERIFDFIYRIEIYVPKKKRKYGYYVYPFLLGDDLVARVDLKADRHNKLLRVNGAFVEAGKNMDYVAFHLSNELNLMAKWLGLDEVLVNDNGNLASALRFALMK